MATVGTIMAIGGFLLTMYEAYQCDVGRGSPNRLIWLWILTLIGLFIVCIQ